MCRQCHKNCRLKLSPSISSSLTVQHSQSSPIRCCQSPTSSSSTTNDSQLSRSSTLTGGVSQLSADQPVDDFNCSTSLVNGHGDSNTSNCEVTKNRGRNNTPCNCNCDPQDFNSILRSAHEVKRETCRLLNSVAELTAAGSGSGSTSRSVDGIKPTNCKCFCNDPISVKPKPDTGDIDDWMLMQIGLALHPATCLLNVDPFEAVPTIAVVPPTPDGPFTKFAAASTVWDTERLSKEDANKTTNSTDVSPDDSPQDEEPPYQTLQTSLKRYRWCQEVGERSGFVY